MDVLAASVGMGWMPFFPQFDRSSLDLADEAGRRRRGSARAPQHTWRTRLGRRPEARPIEDADAPENWPRMLSSWRANLLGSSSKGNEYFLKHLLGTHDEPHGHRGPPRRCGRPTSPGPTRFPRASST